MKSFQDKFIEAFSEAFVDGDKRLIDEYIDFICRIADRVWQERCDGNSAYSIESFQNNCKMLLSVCADSDKDESKYLFVRLLDKLYGILADNVRSTKGLYRDDSLSKISANGINGISSEKASSVNNNVSSGNLCTRLYFNIIDFWSVYFFFNKILSKIDIRILRDEVKISNLLYNMQVIDLALFQERLEIQKRVQASKNQQDTTGSFGSFSTDSNNSTNKMNNCVKQTKFDWKPDSSILYIQQYMGLYLNRQLNNHDITAEEITEFAKSYIISNDCLHSIKADYETMSVLVRTFLIENTVYICGLITAGLTDIAKDVFLSCLNPKDNSYHIRASYFGNSSDEFILPITVFCYLYYLGFWEDEKYVSSELRDKIQKLAKEISYKYREVFTRQDSHQKGIQILTDELRTDREGKFFPRYIYQIMRRFDFRASRESSYTIVTGNMVKDFCLFSIALNNPLPHAFDWVGDSDHDILSYLDYIRDEKATRDELAKFIDFTNVLGNASTTHGEAEGKTIGEKTEEDRLVQTLFERIKLGITSRYKDEIKKEAVKADEEYKQKHKEIENSCRNLEKKIKDVVREKFGQLIDVITDTSVDNGNISSIRDNNNNNNNNHSGDISSDINSYHTVEIFTLSTLTASVNDTLKSQVNFMVTTAYSNLLQEYILLLIKARCLKLTECGRDDKDYIDFLNRNDFDLLFGARRFFMASDLEFAEEFDRTIGEYTQIIANGYSKGFRSALIKKEKLHFYIRNVKVKISDERPFDYKALGDIKLPFKNEEERRELISNERKVITVQAEIRVDPGKASGAYIEE